MNVTNPQLHPTDIYVTRFAIVIHMMYNQKLSQSRYCFLKQSMAIFRYCRLSITPYDVL